MRAVTHLEVILKLAARCNIDCQYCYYFKGGDNQWTAKNKRLNFEVVHQLIHYLDKAIKDHNIQRIQFDFHGGEPLLYGKENLERLCQAILSQLGHKVAISFAIQTNALLINQAWISLFQKYNMRVSVSLDGPKHTNDQQRRDHRGQGTFDKAMQGIQQLKVAESAKQIQPISLLCVISPQADGEEVYRFFVDDLKIYHFDFLLPSTFNEDISLADIDGITQFLLRAWKCWLSDNNPSIRIRFFDAVFSALNGEPGFMFAAPHFNTNVVAMTIDADGKVTGDDSLRANLGFKTQKQLNVYHHSFSQYLDNIDQWYQHHIQLPTRCQTCVYARVCKGGQLEHRYHDRKGFNNPSVYCHTLKTTFSTVIKYLLQVGLPSHQVKKMLLQG